MNHAIKVSIDKKGDLYEADIDKFEINDDLENISVKGTISMSQVQTRLNLSSTTKFTPLYYDLLQIYLKKSDRVRPLPGIFDNLSHHLSPLFGSTHQDANRPHSFTTILNELGTIQSNINLKYTEPSRGCYSMEIKKSTLKSDQCAISIDGNIDHNPQQDLYTFKIAADNYEYIVDTGLNYVDAAHLHQAVFVLLNMKITDAIRHDVKSFIREISDNPDSKSKNLTLTIDNKHGDSYPAIGRY